MARKTTTPVQFRFAADTLADLDLIATHEAERTGGILNRADAARIAIREAAKARGATKPTETKKKK